MCWSLVSFAVVNDFKSFSLTQQRVRIHNLPFQKPDAQNCGTEVITNISNYTKGNILAFANFYNISDHDNKPV